MKEGKHLQNKFYKGRFMQGFVYREEKLFLSETVWQPKKRFPVYRLYQVLPLQLSSRDGKVVFICFIISRGKFIIIILK
jgi:hypothetical protein